ncbi:NACHT domain-containing protein [Actinocrispum wychmicini]|uniref:NACHT domain-containing protein n=1 Tax=Actinocrispum wychmicini TaxID=1213861 RepID=UPI0014052E43|nr:NACHT domain-containing protein [Actinocrispum wychmicini]
MADEARANRIEGTFQSPVVQAGTVHGGIHIRTGPEDELDDLATAVYRQWAVEERIRRVHDPFPIPIRWTADAELSASWASIHGTPDPPEPVDLGGQTGQVDEIVDVFARVPSGRLVVLGDAGAGKSILTLRFALTLLRRRTRGRPVPMIFPVGSWDPAAVSFRRWATAQLVTNHPRLAGSAARLVDSGRILFVLDGFDEIAERLRAQAVRMINADLDHSHQLLLTSRASEYAEAIHQAGTLGRAAVIRLSDLTLDDLAKYLPNTITRPDRQTKWHPVLDRLREADDPVATVLRTPLMVALARTIYSDTDADPMDLFVQRETDLEDRLLAGFIPALYSDAPQDVRLEGARRWRREDALRWLRFLAEAMTRRETLDFEWWRMASMVRRSAVGVLSGLVVALILAVFSLSAWLFVRNLGDFDGTWLLVSIGLGLSLAATAGMAVANALLNRQTPRRTKIKLKGRSREIAGRVRIAFSSKAGAIWMTGWSFAGTIIGMFSGVVGASVGAAVGFAAALGLWFVGALTAALNSPIQVTEALSPGSLLSHDRRTAISEGILVGFGGTAPLWLAVWAGIEPAYGVSFMVAVHHMPWLPLLISGPLGLVGWIQIGTLWGPWLLARTWLAVTGRLPWRLMRFLGDAHRLGVLRQSGGAYQFRHQRLQAYLARSGSQAGP